MEYRYFILKSKLFLLHHFKGVEMITFYFYKSESQTYIPSSTAVPSFTFLCSSHTQCSTILTSSRCFFLFISLSRWFLVAGTSFLTSNHFTILSSYVNIFVNFFPRCSVSLQFPMVFHTQHILVHIEVGVCNFGLPSEKCRNR